MGTKEGQLHTIENVLTSYGYSPGNADANPTRSVLVLSHSLVEVLQYRSVTFASTTQITSVHWLNIIIR